MESSIQFSNEDYIKHQKYIALVEEMYPDMTARELQIFFIVMQNPGILSRDVQMRYDVQSQVILNQIMSISTRYKRRRSGGYGLIEAKADEEDLRYNRLYPTKKGRLFFKVLNDTLKEVT